MKKRTIFALSIMGLLLLTYIGFIIYGIATDPWSDMYKDKVEYPLALVDMNGSSDYMLVKWQHSPVEMYEIVTDTNAIKANASVFSVDNKGKIYGTTADGIISLFEDGKEIDTVLFDNTLTKKIEYGTLQFRQVNQLQYLLLRGYIIVEQSENHSILFNNQEDKPYYFSFAHGEDLEDIETVCLINSESNIDEIAKPRVISDDIVEFKALFPTYAGEEMRYWYFRRSDHKLSQGYLNVATVQENIIVCTDSNYSGPKIIVCDMFDKSIYYKEIDGDFSEEADRLFLLNAEFVSEKELKAEYIGKDEQVYNSIFSLA